VLTCESIKAVDGSGITIYGYSGDADLLQVSDASVERFAITTSTGGATIVLTFTDDAGAATITYDHDATAEFTCNHAFEALEIDTATIGATDGANAITITASTGVCAFAATPTGTDLDFSGTLYADKVYADQLEDEAGSGAPTMAHGVKLDTVTANSAAGVTVVGYAGDADLLQVADASTERFAITTSASADSIVLTFTDKDGAATLTYDHGATAEFNFNHAVEATEFNAGTFGAADGANAFTVADSTGVVAFAATPTGTDLDFSGTLYGDKVYADTIENEAGTGAPTFTHGLTLTGASSPPTATSTPEGCLWVTNGTPDGGKTAWKLYVFVNSTWTAVH
jgi:hypothetical protein